MVKNIQKCDTDGRHIKSCNLNFESIQFAFNRIIKDSSHPLIGFLTETLQLRHVQAPETKRLTNIFDGTLRWI